MRFSKKRIIVAALFSAKTPNYKDELRRLEERIEKRGAYVVGVLYQRRGVSRGGVAQMQKPMSAATLLGKGKARELARLVESAAADAVVFHNELSGSQRSNLSELCQVPVHDAPSLDLAG